MKCPCCGGETTSPLIIYDTEVHLPDGRVMRGKRSVLRMFSLLLKGPVQIKTKNSNITSVAISKLRVYLRMWGLPYRILTDRANHKYILTGKLNVQDYLNAQHSEDVHPGRGVHDLRR